MESEEGHVDSQEADKRDERTENQKAMLEGPKKSTEEEIKETLGLTPEVAGDLAGPDEDIVRDLAGPDHPVTGAVIGSKTTIRMDQREAGKVIESEQGEAGALRGVGTDGLVSSLGQMDEKERAREGGVFLEMGARESKTLARPEHEKEDALIALDEMEAEEVTGRGDVKLAAEVVEEIPGLDQRKAEGMCRDKVDLAGNKEETELAGLGLVEAAGEETMTPAVDQGEPENLPKLCQKEAEEVLVAKDETLSLDFQESGELMGPVLEEVEVLTGEEIGATALDQREAVTLFGLGQEGSEELIGREDVASTVDKVETEKMPKTNKGEAKSIETEGEVAASEGRAEVLVQASCGWAEEETTEMDVVPVAGHEVAEMMLGADQVVAEELTEEGEMMSPIVGASQEEVIKDDVASIIDEGQAEERLWTDEGQAEEGAWTDEEQAEEGAWTDEGQAEEGAWTDEGQAEEGAWTDEGQAEEGAWTDEGQAEEGAWTDEGQAEEGVRADEREATGVSREGYWESADQKKTEGLLESPERVAPMQVKAHGLDLKEGAKEEMKLGMDQVEQLAGEAEDQFGHDQGGVKEVETGKDKVVLLIDQEATVKVAPVHKEALSHSREDALEVMKLTQERPLVLVPELAKIHYVDRMSSQERDKKVAKPSKEIAVVLDRADKWTSGLNLAQEQMEIELAQLDVPEGWGRSGASVMSHTFTDRSEQGCKARGKIITGLAGLRRGPKVVGHRGVTRSAGHGYGVLKHMAPGLIVTGLQNKSLKPDHKHKRSGVGLVEERATRSAEQGRFGPRVKVGEKVVLMGYRTGWERVSCFSEEKYKKVRSLRVPELDKIGKKSGLEQVKPAKKERQAKELLMPRHDGDVSGQHIQEVQLPWFGRPLAQGYEVLLPRSGWTTGVGRSHALSAGPLEEGLGGQVDMMVIGQGASKAEAYSPEPRKLATARKILSLSNKSADVHWLKEVLGPERTPSPLSVTGHGSVSSKAGSPYLTSERRSPDLFAGKQELKDWRDGVMGIAIKKYKALRLAMWGEGPLGLHVKGIKVTGSQATVVPGQKVFRFTQHVKDENVPALTVNGAGLNILRQPEMELSESSLPLESEILEVESDEQEEFSAHTDNSETGSPEHTLGCQGTQELDGSSQWLADQNEAGSKHALEQDTSTTTTDEALGTRGKEQERIKMQSSPPSQSHAPHTQIAPDRMTGSNPVSPASSGSSSSSGSISPPHLTHDSSLDSHLGFDVPKAQNRALVSPGMYASSDPASMWDKTHAEIAEQAKHEAEIENRIAEMKKEGFWSLKRLSKVPEPARPKVHWDYLCEEMQWLSADFAQERRWKRGVARKVVRMVIRHHEEQKQKEERAKREEQAKLRRIASSIAKEVKQFWSNVEKVVQFKQQSRLEEKRKKALDLQLDFIVGQTEKYSDLLSQSLNETLPVASKTGSSHADSAASSPPPTSHLIEDEDGDFQPHEESDDEETIEVEEQQEGNDSETQQREIELLKQEGELTLEELLQSLPPQILENSFSVSPCISSSEEEEGDSDEEEEQEGKQTSKKLKQEKPKPVTQRNKKPWKPDEDDEEFAANEEEAEDEEETIEAEEKLEADVDHLQELDDLAQEGELPMEELLQRYSGAYASDFEMEDSDTLSEVSEPSTSEYEEESEEEDSSSQLDSTEEVESEPDESEGEREVTEEEGAVSAIQEEDFGVEYLLKPDEDHGGEGDNDSTPAPGPKKEITDIAAAAESLQPKGYTLATTQVKTPIPYLLRGTLREYQHIGLDWLVTMYEKKLNGILADEMGLGKTIQTISLLAHLACEKGSWGPHLIIVPTSVMLNWEMEIKRWCPSFKILTYYGAQKERKLKRQGWTKPNAFHICITSYKLVLQDHQAFRRKNWKYLILDEAQNIKNFKSQRWQSLLNFNSQRRLLLTGTPLQNSLMELWSLMHFLMPHVFQSHREFKEWFSNPLTGMIEGSQEYNENLVKRLHKVLRPFLLRRVKVDVEKQMPKKYEHVIKCRLSKRQRYLYDDFMAQATTKETLATGHFMSVINILMQLRKVCNHPNLFDPRPIHSPFITEGVCFNTASIVLHAFNNDPFKHMDLGIFDLINLEGRVSRYETDTFLPKWKVTRKLIEEIAESPDPPPRPKPVKMKVNRMLQPMPKPENRTVVLVNSPRPATPLQRAIAPVLPEPLTPAIAPIQHPGPMLPGPVQPPTLPASVALPVSMSIPMSPSPVTMSIAVPPPSARPQTPTLVPTLSQNNTAAALLQAQASAPQVLPVAMSAAQLVPNTPRAIIPPPAISPTTMTTSSLKPGGVSAPVGQQQQATNALGLSALGPQQPTNALGQQQAPSTLAMPHLGQQQPINALGLGPVGLQHQQPANTLGPAPAAQQSTSPIGGMMKPMSIHSAVPTLPGYNFATAGALQQRLLLSPDMQARLPSGEVVSIGQLASLANRPLQSAPGSKPLTFQIQGNKLTLTGTQVRQVTMPQPARQLPRNVVHLVSAGGQHHIISQPAQVALIQAMAQQAGQAPVGMQAVPGHQPPTILPVPATSAAAAAVASTTAITVPIATTQVPSSAVNSSGVVKIVVRQAPRDGLVSPSPGPQQPLLRPATPTTVTSLPGLSAALMAQQAPLSMNPVPPLRLPTQPLVPVRAPNPAPLQALVRPMLRMVQAPNPSLEQQLVTASPSPTVAPFTVTPAAALSLAANTPAMAPQPTSSPVPKEEPEMLTLRSTTPTPPPPSVLAPRPRRQPPPPPRSPFYLESLEEKRKKQKEERLDRLFRLNEQHCNLVPIYGTEVLHFCTLFPPDPLSWRGEEEEEEEEESEQRAAAQNVEPKGQSGTSYTHCYAAQVQKKPQQLEAYWQRSETVAQAILTPQQRVQQLTDIIERFIFVMPPVEAPAITMHTSHPPPSLLLQQAVFKETLRQELSPGASGLHRIVCNMRTQFPDLRLIQYDCGKLQTLDILLRQLKAGAHRVLIFTQMTRMLDVLEQFLNYHGHIYLRLDGSTRVEQRQALMERFNADKRIFCFILSTRSGGVGVNLTGADTVVFYDSDWNPTMDAQAQDRCHRIGQTRDVHIYRLISERTVEENILKKANQKRMLGDMAIEGGNFTTAYFKQQTIRDLFDMPLDEPAKKEGDTPTSAQDEEEDLMATKQTQILEQALCRAEDPEDIRAATQAKAEQVAELAEFNENIPLDADDRPSKEEEEEMSKAEQEIASLVEQLTPIERYAMNFLEASLEDISREELKQAEEQVEAARKDIDQAKDEVVFKLPEDEDESRHVEEASSRKSKKAKGPSRPSSERTGTRMSERLRSTRLPQRDGDNGELEPLQTRLSNLRPPRVVTEEEEEEEDSLPQVALHTRSAIGRREMLPSALSSQITPHTRRTVGRREELWIKAPSTGERVHKTGPHRTEAPGDRVLRTNPHRIDLAAATGEKSLRPTMQKPDPGGAGDRLLRGILPRTEAQPAGDKVPRSSPQKTDTSLDKVLRPGQQKLSALDTLQSNPPGPETPTSEAQLHPRELDREVPKLKVNLREQQEEETSQFHPPVPETQIAKDIKSEESPAVQPQVAEEKLLEPGTEKAVLETPATGGVASSPVTPVAALELPFESNPDANCEKDFTLSRAKESLPKREENAACSTAEQQASVSPVDDAPRQERGKETDRGEVVSQSVTQALSSPNKEVVPLEATDRTTASKSVSKSTTVEGPAAGASFLPQPESPPLVKEQNGLEQLSRAGDLPCPASNSQPEILPRETTWPIPEPASSEAGSLTESPKQGPRVVGRKVHGDEHQNKDTEPLALSPGAACSQESPSSTLASLGALSSDESPLVKTPRRRTSADVQIRQSCQEQDGPAAKVLRKLPGRLITVVEEKELIRRRRNRTRKLDLANSSDIVSPSSSSSSSSSSAQSVSEPETSATSKELPLLRDLPARRRIELESRAAAKEKLDFSRGEPLISSSTEPVKRKRGRPPKNKSPEQQRPGLSQPSPELALEISPQSQSPDRKVAETISPKSESPKSKMESSGSDSPVEKRRRGRPPKVRESAVMSPNPPATSTKPVVTEQRTKVQEQQDLLPEPASVKEAMPRVPESLVINPKSVSISKARSRVTTHLKAAPVSRSTPKAQRLLATMPKHLSKSSPKLCEPLSTLPRAVPKTETSPNVRELPSPPHPTAPKPALTSPTAESPPKRKRGRPPKNPSSPRVEAAAPPTSTSDQETSIEKKTPTPPIRKRRRRRKKDELGPSLPSANQSSSEGEDTRPLTRLARLKREEKPESGSEGLAQSSPKQRAAEGASSAESSTWEQPSREIATRSTRLRPGSLVPPLERETQRRKRRWSLEGSRVSKANKPAAPKAVSEQEGGDSESSRRSSSESSGNKDIRQLKRQCGESAGGRGRGRGRWRHHHSTLADRVLRSSAKPADKTRSASSPIPTRKLGAASASIVTGAVSGVFSPSTATPAAALVTSSLSNRGRKPKT